MHISKFGIFWGKTSCCLCHIQMPSSLEVIWSWKNYCFWPDYSNNSFSLRGKSQFCGFERYVSVHLLSYIQVSTLLCICIWSFFFFFNWRLMLLILLSFSYWRSQIIMMYWLIGYLIHQLYCFCYNTHSKQLEQLAWLHNDGEQQQLLFLEGCLKYEAIM